VRGIGFRLVRLGRRLVGHVLSVGVRMAVRIGVLQTYSTASIPVCRTKLMLASRPTLFRSPLSKPKNFR
jgi:hypothetical protein